MQKVYGRTTTLIIFVVFSFCGSFFVFHQTQKPGFGGWVVIVWTIAIFFVFVRSLFVPDWIYDEKGLEILMGISGNVRKGYLWTDIKSVWCRISWESPFMKNYGFSMKDGRQIYIGFETTRNSSKVLSDVVHLVQKNNPNAQIYPDVFKRIEKV